MTPEREAAIRTLLADCDGEIDAYEYDAAARDLLAALDEARRDLARMTAERDAAESALGAAHATLAEAHRLRVERDAALADCDGWKDIADRRYALRSELEAALGIPHGPAEPDSVEKAHARLRAILDERDAARAEEQVTRARWQSSLVSLRTGTLERERDAALAREARLREAAAGIETVGGRGLTPESAAVLNAALGEVGPWPATATTWLADRERAAEERGRVEVLTAMEVEAARKCALANEKIDDVRGLDPREAESYRSLMAQAGALDAVRDAVCRAAREK